MKVQSKTDPEKGWDKVRGECAYSVGGACSSKQDPNPGATKEKTDKLDPERNWMKKKCSQNTSNRNKLVVYVTKN